MTAAGNHADLRRSLLQEYGSAPLVGTLLAIPHLHVSQCTTSLLLAAGPQTYAVGHEELPPSACIRATRLCSVPSKGDASVSLDTLPAGEAATKLQTLEQTHYVVLSSAMTFHTVSVCLLLPLSKLKISEYLRVYFH